MLEARYRYTHNFGFDDKFDLKRKIKKIETFQKLGYLVNSLTKERGEAGMH